MISGSAAIGVSYYKLLKQRKFQDKHYEITAIVQTGPEREQLKTVYLAELLDLSVDKPINIYAFDVKRAKEKLLANPLIKEVEVKKVLPRTLYINYSIRKPIAYLGDYANTALDDEMVLLPFKPFFSPKKIPILTFGADAIDAGNEGSSWGKRIAGDKAALALDLLHRTRQLLTPYGTEIKRVDVSKALVKSFGQRQVVLTLEERFSGGEAKQAQALICPVILRLDPNHFDRSLRRYLLVKDEIIKKVLQKASVGKQQKMVVFSPIVIDLRIPDLALLSQ